MKNSKKISIALAVIFLVCTLVYTIKPIYYRVYPFDRFTVNYTISYNGEEVRCKEKYYCFEDDNKIPVRKTGKNRFKIRGGAYGIYNIGFVVDTKSLYALTDYNEDFLAIEPFDCSFRYFNTNWWHITDIDIYIDFFEADNEWYANCKMVITEPDVDESGRVHTDTLKGTFLVRDINNYDHLPLSSDTDD